MKALNIIQKSIKTVEGYKNQFVYNDKPNLLLVDPCLKTYDYYAAFLPAITMYECDACNIAFTNIRKFIEDVENINLSPFEIKWANTIVFPFSLMPLFNLDNFRDEIKKINPEITIIYNVEIDFTNHDLLKELKSQLQVNVSLLEFAKKIEQHQLININSADIIVTHSQHLKNKLQKSTKNKKLKVEIIPIANDQNFIRQGLKPEMSKTIFRDSNETKVYIEFSSIEDENDFIENILDKSPDNIVFYSRSKNNKFLKLKPTTITHKYKELYMYNFDFYVLYSKNSSHDFLNIKIGELLDAAMFGAVPVVVNNKFKSYIQKWHKGHDYIVYFTPDKLLELISIDYNNRIKLGNEIFEKAKKHHINEHYFIDIFKIFFSCELNEKIESKLENNIKCSECHENNGIPQMCSFEKDVHDKDVECNCCIECSNKCANAI